LPLFPLSLSPGFAIQSSFAGQNETIFLSPPPPSLFITFALLLILLLSFPFRAGPFPFTVPTDYFPLPNIPLPTERFEVTFGWAMFVPWYSFVHGANVYPFFGNLLLTSSLK